MHKNHAHRKLHSVACLFGTMRRGSIAPRSKNLAQILVLRVEQPIPMSLPHPQATVQTALAVFKSSYKKHWLPACRMLD